MLTGARPSSHFRHMNWAKGTGVLVECITTFSTTPTTDLPRIDSWKARMIPSHVISSVCVSFVSYFTAQFARGTRFKSMIGYVAQPFL